MQQPNAYAEDQQNVTPSPLPWRDAVLIRALRKTFGSETIGRLEVVLPSGARVMLGSGTETPDRVTLASFKALWRLATRGSLGLAESYMRAEIDSADLGGVLRFCLKNYGALERAGGGVMKPRLTDVLWHRRRDNTLRGSRRNIAAHYDLGNAFYKLWLDPGMTYSSAIFRAPSDTLQAAQDEKYRVVLDSLALSPGDKVLEIGCGWGGLAEHAIRRGAHVTGLTLSTEQLAYANARLERAGMAPFADLRLQDYRATTGTFDAIASVEMIEAVGEGHWPAYFKTLFDRLRPGGRVAIQAITIDERYFDSYRRQADFIQRYIFPGGMLPTVTRMQQEAAAAGLTFETVERFGPSYATTLAAWRPLFRQHWPAIKDLGFDERFRRMWEYYFTYCEVGFESGDIDVGIYRLTKPAQA